MSRFWIWMIVAIFCSLAALGCSRNSTPTDPNSDPADPNGDPTDPNGPTATMERYAAHRFVAVDDTVDLSGLGEYLDDGVLDGETVLEVNASQTTAQCQSGGVGWVRFKYRDVQGQNGVQTLVIVCVNEEGVCTDLPRIEADLESLRDGSTPGAADMLTAGEGSHFAVCRSEAGVRLQRPPPMPQPLYRIVDAWGDGPYSIGGQEFEWTRNTHISSYSGENYQPSWIVDLSWEDVHVELNGDGSLSITRQACEEGPGCPVESDWARPGDFVNLHFGPFDLESDVDAASDEVRENFANERVPGAWSDLEEIDENVRDILLYRLIGFEVMDQMLDEFDERYGLNDADVRIGFGSFWQSRYLLPNHCLPDNQSICEQVETALEEYERSGIQTWRDKGFEVWWDGFLGYQTDGKPKHPPRPNPEIFDGVLGLVEVSAPAEQSVDRAAAVANAIQSFVAETPSSLPLAFAVQWGPMEHVIEINGFCEAEICPSAFTAYYMMFEPTISVILSDVPRNRLVGFGVPMFDGGHFDIQDPYEELGSIRLNRVGETGFNNPLMNLYYAR